MQTKPGSMLGGILLIGGSCIGAGMLGLPIVTGLCGFKLSLMIFIISWAFMTATGLLLVEINGWFIGNVDLSTMINNSLNKRFRQASWILYLFLFYSLLVAYFAGLGSTSKAIGKHLELNIPTWGGSILFGVFVSIMLYRSLTKGMKIIDLGNRVFMFGKIGAYLAIVMLGIGHLQPQLLQYHDLQHILTSLPIMVIAFGFHNLIPTITEYMNGDLKRVRTAVICGSCFALIIYLLWDFVVLGIVPIEGKFGLINSHNQGRDAAYAIARILQNSAISHFAEALAFFAFLTALLIQALALTHFLKDCLPKKSSNLFLLTITLVPPLSFAIYDPSIFFKALDFAGGICAVILFGIFPALMAWNGRYHKKFAATGYCLKGGKISLVMILLFALFIMGVQLSNMLG